MVGRVFDESGEAGGMKGRTSKAARIDDLIRELKSDDGIVRGDSREALVALGEYAVLPLVKTLKNSDDGQVRWEAAKALDAIGASASIPALVKALEDREQD